MANVKIYIMLSMKYPFRLGETGMNLTIGNKETTLTPYVGRPPQDKVIDNFHYYLVLQDGDKEWIIDPSWKQFACKQKTIERGRKIDDGSDPFNQALLNDYPNILVIPRNDIRAFIESLGKDASSPDIIKRAIYWDKSYSQADSSFNTFFDEDPYEYNEKPKYKKEHVISWVAEDHWHMTNAFINHSASSFTEFTRLFRERNIENVTAIRTK
jgi:hypothetical protein